MNRTNVLVLTHLYQHEHGRAPRGRGSWAFHPSFNARGDDPSIFWAPTGSTFTEAKRAAQKHFADRGINIVHVLP